MAQRTGIGRRRLLKTGAALAAFAPAIIARRATAAEDTIYVNTFGGVWTEAEDAAFYKPFTEKTGIKVQPVPLVTFAKLKAQVQTGTYEWDCSNFSSINLKQAVYEGLLDPIDYSVFHKESVPATVILGDSVASVAVGTPLVYRKDKFPNGGPKSWADFWDVKKFPGTRSLYNQSYTMLAYALLADGVPKDKLYPLDLDRAFKKMDEIKPHIKVWWTQGAQSQSLIKDGEVDMIAMWNGRAQDLIDQGQPVEIVWNQSQNYASYWFVAKGSPRAKLAWQFIEFTAQPKPQADFCNRLPYGPTNAKAFDFMTKEAIAKAPTAPDHVQAAFEADDDWLASRMSGINERWAQWLAT